MTIDPTIGQLAGRGQIETAVLTVLTEWVPLYLNEIETQNGLPTGTLPRPAAPESIHGGVNGETWDENLLPEIIVIAEPVGDSIRFNSAGDFQSYALTVHAIVTADSEDATRNLADLYGAMIVGGLAQHADLDGQAVETVLTSAARTELVDQPDAVYTLQRAVATFRVLFGPVVNDLLAPASTAWPIPAAPTVETTSLIVEAGPDNEPVTSATETT